MTIRRLTSTDGAHIRWQARPDAKWFGNSTAGAGLSDAEVVSALSAAGHKTVGAVVEWGDYSKCPRCNGTGRHCGGQCFRCYGSASTSWIPKEGQA